MSIYDKEKQKMVIYSSNEDVTAQSVVDLVDQRSKLKDMLFEHYINDDFNMFKDDALGHVDKNESIVGKKRMNELELHL